jgi:tetratricopeptide (TPR) repeat protein
MEGGAATDRARRDPSEGGGAVTTLPPAVSALLVGLGIAQAFRQAVILQDQGRLDEAERLYRRILAREPEHAASLCRLGAIRVHQGRLEAAVILMRRAVALANSADAQAGLGTVLAALGRPAEAVACFEAALAVDGNPAGKPRGHAETHFQLGNALRALGRHDAAASHFERALTLNPALAQAHCNLGVTVAELIGPRTAIVHYERALAAKPDLAEAHVNLADALRMLDRRADAIAHYEQGLALRPGLVEAHNNLAVLLEAAGRREEAIAHYRAALAIRPDHSAISNNLTILLQKLARFDEALACGAAALERDPADAEAHNAMGLTLLVLGRIEEAHRAQRRAIELAPRRADFHLNLANSTPFSPGDPRIATLETLAQEFLQDPAQGPDAAPSDNDRMALHFALGKAYRDLEQHERSFRHVVAGNALKRRQTSYDEATTLGRMERIRTVFSAELMGAKRGCGDPSGVPVFVVGMLRSGTTLIEQILASHSKVHGAGELDDFRAAAARIERANGGAFLDVVSDISGEELRRIGATYADGLRARAPTAERVVDKMPSNFQLAGLINLALPNARIIHVRRDPVDTCVSCFSLLFAGDQPYAYDLGELGRYYGAYERLMAHWRDVLPAGVMLEVSYEDVVDDLDGQARRIIAHCGLAWEDACLAFHQTRRPVQTASATQVRQPIYRGSVGRWRPYRDLLQPLLQALEWQDPAGAT